MKTKILSLMLAVLMILSSLPLAGLTVFAETNSNEITDEYLQEMLDLLPTEWYVDFPELEYQRAEYEIENRAKEIWSENGIDLTGIEIDVYPSHFYYGTKESFYEGYIGLNAPYIVDNNEYSRSKGIDISITYNNSQNYNLEDERAIKDLKIETLGYHEIGLDSLLNRNVKDFLKVFGNHYSKVINDSSIAIIADCGAAGGSPLGWGTAESGTVIAIFKNDVLYDIRKMGDELLIPVITVPEDIPENEMIDYATNIIEEYFKNSGWLEKIEASVLSITKGATVGGDYYGWTKDVKDGYTVRYQDTNWAGDVYEEEEPIVIRREANTDTPVVDDTIIADGTDETYVIGSGSGASIHCSHPLDEFISVYINGELVDEANYTLKEGSTILTFKSEYLDTLPTGVYEITLNFVSGSVSTNLTIEKASIDDSISENTTAQNTEDKNDTAKSPSTGAANSFVTLAAMAFACGTVMFVKKKEQE